MKFKVVPISSEIAAKARRSLISPQYKSLKAFVDVATGYGPCRSCLKTFREGEEERLFFTYNAFEGLSDLPDPGPIFIHNEECREKAASGNIETQIAGILGSPLIEYVHIRNYEAGCFIARIETVG